ncbi:antitoxin [Saccharopolyspora sp. NPDC002376]
MGFLDKAKELANQAKGKAEELAEKAGPSAAKGLDAAKSSLDKATGGKYHDKIETVSNKVEGMLKREHPDGQPPKPTDEKGPGETGQDPKNP